MSLLEDYRHQWAAAWDGFATEGLRCPARTSHWAHPVDYVTRAEWSAKLSETHDQIRCAGCGRFWLWRTREAEPILTAPEYLREVRDLLRTLVILQGCQTYHVPGRQCETCREYVRRVLPKEPHWGNDSDPPTHHDRLVPA